MNLYLNDWSLSGNGDLVARWDKVDRWFELVKHLSVTYGISQIGGPKNLMKQNLCGYNLGNCFSPVDTVLDNDKKQLLQTICNYVRKADYDESTPIVIDGTGALPPSMCLGRAYELSSSVVSFTFDSAYEKESVTGIVRQSGQKGKNCSINNLYDINSIDIPFLVPYGISQQYKADECPMWNQDMMTAYCESIGHNADRTSKSDGEKIAYLKLHGRVLAEMNGWRYDENKTKLNHTDEHQRLIFRSANFKSDNCYLSIDFEKEDFHFELLDHRGCHLREIDWHGNTTGGADAKHNIRLKR